MLPAVLQAQTAEVIGTVTDASGAIVPGAKVTLTNLATAEEYSAVADGAGNYVVRLLPVGRYKIRAELQGFKTWTVPEVRLSVGDRLRQEIRLEVGQIEQSVEVVASSPTLQTDSSSLGRLSDERAVQDLPLNGRNFVALAQLAPGSSGEGQVTLSMSSGERPDDRRRSGTVIVNAQDAAQNGYFLDGMDNNERTIGTLVVRPSIEAIAEMKVQTSLPAAEWGRTAGASINLITKSGANDFHGSVFEYFRNEKMDARNFFARPADPKPAYKQNQFGGSLGGPIIKNRTFFFADYEGLRLRKGLTYTSTVPTLAMREGNFSGINPIFDVTSTRPDPSKPGGYIRDRFNNDTIPKDKINQISLALVNLYPKPQTSALANNFTWSPAKKQRDDGFDVRIDHMLSNVDSLFGRYSFNDTFTYVPGSLPVAENGIDPVGDVSMGGNAYQRSQAVALNYVHTFGPQLATELKAGYTRFVINNEPPNYNKFVSDKLGIPGANYDLTSSGLTQIAPSGFRSIGDGSWLPLIMFTNTFQVVGNVMYVKGTHSIKVGLDVRRRHLTPFQSQTPQGNFAFDANFTNDPSGTVKSSGNSIASLLMGYPSSTARNKTLMWAGYRTWEDSIYFQDDWRATQWLTLNMGVRYDYYSPISEVNNLGSNLDIALRKLVIPEVDTTRTYGVARDWLNLNLRFGFAATLREGTVLRGGAGTIFVPTLMSSNQAFRNPPFVNTYAVTPTVVTPINSISDGFPVPTASDPLNPRGSLSVVAMDMETPYSQQYNLTLQQQLPFRLVGSASFVGLLGRKLTPIPGGTAAINTPYPAPGAVNPRRPWYNTFPNASTISLLGIGRNSNYQALQMSLERRFEAGFGAMATYTWAHALDNFEDLIQSTGRQAVYGNSMSDIRHRFTMTSNWEIPYSRSATGFTRALTAGWTLNGVVDLSTGLPFTVTNSSARSNTGSSDRPDIVGDPELPSSERTVAKWFNTSAFAPQALYTYGNLGKYTMHGPGRIKFDLALHRMFNLNETLRLQFRAEMFNMFNTPAFATPGAGLGSSTFGTISSAGEPRNIQFALKMIF